MNAPEFAGAVAALSARAAAVADGPLADWLAGWARGARRIVEVGTGDGRAFAAMGAALADDARAATLDRACVLTRAHAIPSALVEDARVAYLGGDAASPAPYAALGFPVAACDLVVLGGPDENRVLGRLRDAGLTDGTPVVCPSPTRAWWSALRMPRFELPVGGATCGVISFQAGLWEPIEPIEAPVLDLDRLLERARAEATRRVKATAAYGLLRQIVRRVRGS